MKFDLRPWILSLAAALSLAACTGEAAPSAGTSAVRPSDSLAAVAASLRLDSLRQAFLHLQDVAFTRHVETAQLTPEGQALARRVYLVRYNAPGTARIDTVRTLAASGSFDFGIFGDDAPAPAFGEDPLSFAEDLIPTDPPYLSARSIDNFIYGAAPDTMIEGRRIAVLVARAAPEATDQPTRLARLYYDPGTRNVVALYREQENPAFLFREHTASFVRATWGGAGLWLPDSMRVDTRIHLPFTAPRHFRTASRFSDFAMRR